MDTAIHVEIGVIVRMNCHGGKMDPRLRGDDVAGHRGIHATTLIKSRYDMFFSKLILYDHHTMARNDGVVLF